MKLTQRRRRSAAATPSPRNAPTACARCSPRSRVDPAVVLLGRETIYRDGERVGWLTSGGYGYTIDRSIGYGYVRNPDGVTARLA